jgi:hypothetical protein
MMIKRRRMKIKMNMRRMKRMKRMKRISQSEKKIRRRKNA